MYWNSVQTGWEYLVKDIISEESTTAELKAKSNQIFGTDSIKVGVSENK